VGATVKCHPTHLFHFGIMGDSFARMVFQIDAPRVGLLNIGAEDKKGNELVKNTHALFSQSDLHFIGNVEGQEIFGGRCHVVVCEGFVGNVVLKVTEGMAALATHYVKQFLVANGSPIGDRIQRELEGKTDFSSYGGAILLGVNGICIICHGRSGRRALANATIMAARYTEARVVDGIITELASNENKIQPRVKSV
jgi:phosphate acyltransferase